MYNITCVYYVYLYKEVKGVYKIKEEGGTYIVREGEAKRKKKQKKPYQAVFSLHAERQSLQ